jgi:outer membrane protein
VSGAGRVQRCVAAVVLALAAGAAGAETLRDAWRIAEAGDDALAAAELDATAAVEGVRAARGAHLPSIDAEGSYLRFNQAPAFDIATPALRFQSPPMFDNDDVFMGSIQARLPVYAGGQVVAGVRAARADADAATSVAKAARAGLKLEVAQAYVDVQRAQRSLRAATAIVASLDAHVGDVSARVEREASPQSDLLAAQAARANVEQSRLRAVTAEQLAWANYNRLLGEPADRRVDLEPVDAAQSGAELASIDLGTLVDRARQSRDEARVFDAQARGLDARARAEIGRLLPQVALVGGYNYLENDVLNRDDFSMVGIGIRWSLFDGGQARHRAAALRAGGRAARHRADDLRSQVELDVRRARLELDEAQARIAATRAAAAQAEENLRMVREQYDVGLATNADVLQAVALQQTSVAFRDDAAADAILAGIRLRHAVGEL